MNPRIQDRVAWPRRAAVGWPVIAAGLCRSRLAYGQIGGAELLARLGWLAFILLGGIQIAAALLIRRHLPIRAVRPVVAASLIAFLIGALAAIFIEDPRTLTTVTSILSFLPGLPLFMELIRTRVWALAIVLFIAPPLPFLV